MSLSALDALRRLEGPEHFDVVATVNILGTDLPGDRERQ